jgi:hypothetical protein
MTDPIIDTEVIPNPVPAHAVEIQKKDHLLSNKLYDAIKFIAQVFLPAAGTLYSALSGMWGFPNVTQVVGSIVAVDLFLGVLLGLSTNSYKYSSSKYDGTIEVETGDTGKKTFTLALDSAPEELEDKEEVVFNVHKTLPE